MKIVRRSALILLLAILAAALLAEVFAKTSYSVQFRDFPNAPGSRQFLLGTDDLGRDRFSRLLYGTRLCLLLAPAAALFATLLGALIGGVAGYRGGWWDRSVVRLIDLMLSLPWLFLLIAVRAVLPLNVSPIASMLITFGLLGLLGWAAPARVVRASARAMRESEFILQAKACGLHGARLFFQHVAPNLKPVLRAQFWTAIPVFILSEANLGLLGLGVAEPLPSWGNLLRQLETQLSFNVWLLSPLILLVVVVSCFQLILPVEDWRS